ncbi:unnamed protein product, partial [Iphiclides podalirius]
MFSRALLLAAAAMFSSGQEHEPFADIATSTRQLVDGITKLPIVQQASRVSGDLLTGTAEALAAFPLALARSLTLYDVPQLVSDSNVVELTDRVISEFNAGLRNEDIHMSIGDLVTKYRYAIERHQVVTDDGYVLTVHRIPSNGSVVLLMHGLLGSSDDFVVSGPKSGLAYLLADEGYDVWMGNGRGNKHSRRHLSMDPSQASFWDFSWHEIGCRDLPATIDHILRTTDAEKLQYVGHSQGTTAFFVMASERPEYNEKVSLMVALSPVAFMTHAKAPLVKLLAPGTPLLHSVLSGLGVYELLPDNASTRVLKKLMCGVGPLAEIVCSNVIFIVAGLDLGQLNVTNLPVIYGHMPSGASSKQFAHYGQGMLSGDFRQFDYGERRNIELYGSKVPPAYKLRNVKTPVSLFYCQADWLADPRDVDRLYKKLGNVIDTYKVPYNQFSHLDFVLAKDFKTLIYSRLRKLLMLY